MGEEETTGFKSDQFLHKVWWGERSRFSAVGEGLEGESLHQLLREGLVRGS